MVNYCELVVNNPQYFKQFSCKDLLFLDYGCAPLGNKSPYWRHHNFFYYVVSGQKELQTSDASFLLAAGSSLFIKKGTVLIEKTQIEPFCALMFIIPDSFIVHCLEDYKISSLITTEHSSPIIEITSDDNIYGFFQSMLTYFISFNRLSEDIIELKFKELLLHVFHSPKNKQLYQYFLTLAKNNYNNIREIMESNYVFDYTIEDYARMTNRSLSSFKRDFMNIYKTTPGRWLMNKKLEHAKNLLIRTDHKIADVAYNSGFENAAHFTKFFKQKTGCTPMEFRKKTLLESSFIN